MNSEYQTPPPPIQTLLYGLVHEIVERAANAQAGSILSVRCSYTRSMDDDEGSGQNIDL